MMVFLLTLLIGYGESLQNENRYNVYFKHNTKRPGAIQNANGQVTLRGKSFYSYYL